MSTGSREHHNLVPRQIYEAYLDRLKRGEKPDFADLCARYPTIAEELRELHGGQETVGQLPSSLALPASNAAAALPTLPPAGRYADRRRLARGGMGVIYSVSDKLLHRQLAMKVIRQQDPSPTAAAPDAPAADGAPTDARLLARFVREAEITARLDHPGVVPIHDLGVDANGRMFFTMRLVQGKSLASVLHQARHDHQAWPQTRVIDLIVKVCETVAYAHSRRVIHRDLKPDNIMVGAFGETYVMDWGLAKLRPPPGAAAVEEPAVAADDTVRLSQPGDPSSGRASSGSAEETEMGCVLGTAFYMPPEQAAGRIDKLDERSDIYSVGAILYELLCGQRPYAESGRSMTFDEVVDAVLVGPPRSIAEVNPRVPSELAAICEKAMARAQPQRYQGMLEMADDLRAYLENRVVRAYQTGAWAELKKWVKRNRGLAVASALVLVVSLSGLLGVVGVQSWANARLTKANDDILTANHKIRDESNQKAAALEQKTAALQTAETERRRAEGLYLARQAADVVAKNPAQALLLALESHDRRPGFEANSALLAALAEHHELRTMYGHQRAVRGLSLSPDRKRLVTRSDDTTAIVWDLAAGKPTAWLIGHDKRLAHAEFSPDGRWVVTTSYDNTAALWDATTGRRLRVFHGHTQPLYRASFSPDGRTLATASADGTVRLWDTETGAVRHVLSGHAADVNYVAFSPDGTQVVSTSADRIARLWSVSTGAQEHMLQGHVGGVAMALFTSDGKQLVTAAGATVIRVIKKTPPKKRQQDRSSDKSVFVWNVQTGQVEHRLEHRSVVHSLALGSQSGRIVAGCADGSIRIWNLASGQTEHEYQAAGSIATLSFSLDERLIAAGNDRGEVWLVDAPSGELVGIRRGHTDEVVAALFASAEQLVTASRDRSVRVWSTRPAYECAPNAAGKSGGAVLASPDGSRFVIGHARSSVWQTEQGATTPRPLQLCALPDASALAELPHDEVVGAVMFSPEGSLIATLSRSGKIGVWSARDGSLLAKLAEDHAADAAFRDPQRLVVLDRTGKTVNTWSLSDAKLANRLSFANWKSLILSGDGRKALAWSAGHSQAELWDVDRSERIAVLSVPLRAADDNITAVFSPDSTLLATSAVRHPPPLLWDTATGKSIAEITVSGPDTHVSFSDDSSVLLTRSTLSIARTFDTRTGALLAELSGYEPTSPTAMFGPTGDRVIVTSLDGHSRLWDAHSGRMLMLMGDHDEAVQKAVFSHDGRLLLALNRNGDRAVLWDARQGERLAVVGSGAPITDMDFSPDGQWFITAFADGSARVWPVSPAALAARRASRALTPDERDLYRLGDAQTRRRCRLNWKGDELVELLSVASRMPFDGAGQEDVVRAVLAARVDGLLELLQDQAPSARVAELKEIEKIIGHKGGLAPIIKMTLADAYRKNGAPQQMEQQLQSDVDKATVK